MRKARRQIISAIPQNLDSLANLLEQPSQMSKYLCCNQPFFVDRIVDGNGATSVLFACSDLISELVALGCNELHADGTFKVVPSTPKSQQLFILHLVMQNHVSYLFYIVLILRGRHISKHSLKFKYFQFKYFKSF